jgi:uncharacterized membrane protein
MDSLGLHALTAIGVLLVLDGMYQMLFRRQATRDRQKSYDPSRWWSHPSIGQERTMTLVSGLLILALGIFLIVASQWAVRQPDGY